MDAVLNPDNYNLADFLNFDTAKIILNAISFCKKKKIQISSTSLFYFAVRFGKDINLICFRLGLNPKKLQADLKNYLEKIPKQNVTGEFFSDDFQETIALAFKISADRQHKDIRICPPPVKPIKAFYGPALPDGILGSKARWPQIDRTGQAFYFSVSVPDKLDSS